MIGYTDNMKQISIKSVEGDKNWCNFLRLKLLVLRNLNWMVRSWTKISIVLIAPNPYYRVIIRLFSKYIFGI